MNLSLEIAKRYLIAKKTTNAINIIMWTSILGLTIGTAALILILSVFNGFESVLADMFNKFNPELKVMPLEGKYFTVTDEQIKKIKALPIVHSVSKTIEESTLFEYKGVQEVGILKGVDDQFRTATDIDSSLRAGKLVLGDKEIKRAIVATGMSGKLSLNYNDALTPVVVYMPLRENKFRVAKDFKTMNIYATGVFSAGDEADNQYIITDYDDVNRLLDLENNNSYLEFRLTPGADIKQAKQDILSVMGDGFEALDRYEQDKDFFKVMNMEKWVSYLIATFTLLIIAFNLVGSLWMLVLEKKKDLSILQAVGFTPEKVRNLVLYQGALVTIAGMLVGLVLAIIIYFLQKNYGIISISDGFLIDAYPVVLKVSDVIVSCITVLILGLAASLLPAIRAGKITPFVRMEQ